MKDTIVVLRFNDLGQARSDRGVFARPTESFRGQRHPAKNPCSQKAAWLSTWSTIHPKFMLKNPVMNVSGTKIVATTLTTYARSFSCIEHHPERVHGGVDRLEQAGHLILEPGEVRLLGGAEVSKRSGFDADALEDRLLVPDPAPHRREPATGLPQRRPRHASAVRLRPRRDQRVQPQFHLV
jgi:hypothetical protein